MARKTCFLVMPFHKKLTGLTADKGPEKVDFDRLFREPSNPHWMLWGMTWIAPIRTPVR